MPLCHYYQEGHCRNGNRCNFTHAVQHSRYDEHYGYRGGATSPNRIWVNPQSKYHHADQQYSNHYDRTYNDYGNKNYNSSQFTRHDSRDYENHSSSRSHLDKGRQRYKENSGPQSASSFSFTKALNSAQSSSNSVSNSSVFNSAQPSLQDRVKPATNNSSAGTSSFSFVQALQENKTNIPVGASGDSSMYSKADDLTEDQKLQFESSEFTWGQIPLLPPSIDLC
uniref:Nucleoporin NUP42 n=1 Tax=Cacopsylla melanoneura TaxID=428564 RepID=A0A8D8LYA4_9HEMI